MRYDNWDIILFPDESNIPIPEYKTACYFSRDEDGVELPTLRTYIGSLKPETPFRISVHHWGPQKPSPFIQQVQRRVGSDITFTVQVIIDGTRLYHGSFAVDTSSPQEIAYEQRSFRSSHCNEQPTSHPKQRLLFPKSDKNALLQSSAWQPRGTDNRIKIILSERLINEEGSLSMDCWGIVCFSFQHGPRELLEQAGIAYPIIDPLRSLVGDRATFTAKPALWSTKTRTLQRGSRENPKYSPDSDLESCRPPKPEQHKQPPARMTSTYPSQLMGNQEGGVPGVWHDFYRPFIDGDISMETWPSQRYASNVTGVQGFHHSPLPQYTVPTWPHGMVASGQHTGPNMGGTRRRKDNNAQQVRTALRDEQFGQVLEALSPSKMHRGIPNELLVQQQKMHQLSTQPHRLPRMGALSVPVRPASAAVASSAAYHDPNVVSRNGAKRPSSEQANFSANGRSTVNPRTMHHTDNKENRDSRIPTHNPLAHAPQQSGSDVSARDGSPNFSSLSRFEADPVSLGSTIGGKAKSKKRGLAAEVSDSLDIEIRQDPSLLVVPSAKSTVQEQRNAENSERTSRNHTSGGFSGVPDHVEIIDVDAIDPNLVAETTADLAKLSPFKPFHKAGMSSISSTGLLERQLYSALGEELGSFEQQISSTGMGPELAQALSGVGTDNELIDSTMPGPTLSDFGPAGKRKRQGTLGGERDPSPMKKKEGARKAMVEDEEMPEDLPQMRGD
ncbi:hypothetical protein C7974DRAFT_386478 [Boeremia exigua]|uniref:uncharacterized protein n=1 Tax=Boeremia exigua TaxID=749465 RepID=UPI001E8E923E|nr:uncharacterized protein C7974DRAFT_386478 [Boeremia exigua]KAH6642962.1 hypothetical protein C7974DRAFT_386478 [Boeremia exigua]